VGALVRKVNGLGIVVVKKRGSYFPDTNISIWMICDLGNSVDGTRREVFEVANHDAQFFESAVILFFVDISIHYHLSYTLQNTSVRHVLHFVKSYLTFMN